MKIKNKKKTIIISIIILLVGAGVVLGLNGYFGGGSAIPSDTMTRGLVGYWNMDEGGGGIVKDSSNNGNNGTIKTGQEKDGWLYKVPLTVSNPGSELTGGFQVSVTINTSALISAGKMRSDCDDARFFDSNNSDPLDYWIETDTCDTTATIFWVEIPTIPTSGKTIYMYYGNPSAERVSDGELTFIWFDDFTGAHTWDASGGGTYTTTDYGSVSASKEGSGNIQETLTTHDAVTTGNYKVGLRIKNASTATGGISSHDYEFRQPVTTSSRQYYHSNSPSDDNTDWVSKYYTVLNGTNPKLEIWVSGTGDIIQGAFTSCTGGVSPCSEESCWISGFGWDDNCVDENYCINTCTGDYWGCKTPGPNCNTDETTCLTTCNGTANYASINYTGSASLYIDDVFVRQYSATEPIVTAGGEIVADYSSLWTKGKKGNALKFDGKDDHIEVPQNSSLDISNKISIEFWMKFALPNEDKREFPISKYNWQSSGFFVEVGKNGNPYLAWWTADDTDQDDQQLLWYPFVDGSWYHVVANTDGETKRIYINGKLESEQNSPGLVNYSNILRIGADDGDYPFDGVLDEVRVYNRALSADEVRYHYNQGGPVAEWKFDEGSGSVAKDSTENNNDGAVYIGGLANSGGSNTLTDDYTSWATNEWAGETIEITSGIGSGQTRTISSNTDKVITVSSAWETNPGSGSVYRITSKKKWAAGKDGSALQFSGAYDYVSTSKSYSNPTVFTESLWFKTNTTSGGDLMAFCETVACWNTSDSYDRMIYMTDAGKIIFGTYSGSYYTITSPLSYNDNIWHYVSASVSSAGMSLYIDGLLVGSDPNTLSLDIDGYWIIGANQLSDWPSAPTNNPFTGLIDDVSVYDYARSQEEIQLGYNSGEAIHLGPTGKSCAKDPASCVNNGLVGYWNMDEGGASTAKDSSGNGNNGTLTNGPLWTKGKKGNALKFDGVDDYVNLTDQDYFSPAVNDITVSVWVKVPETAPAVGQGLQGSQGSYFVSKGSTDNWEWAFENDNNTKLYFALWQSDGLDHGYVGIDRTMNDGKWHFYSATVRYLSKVILYVDGSEVANTTSFSGAMSNGSQTVQVGERGDGNYFSGTIDEVRIYNRALTPEEINYLYNEKKPVGQWDLDEGGGTTVHDSAGNLNITFPADPDSQPAWSKP